jgi:hypothetical protein
MAAIQLVDRGVSDNRQAELGGVELRLLQDGPRCSDEQFGIDGLR